MNKVLFLDIEETLIESLEKPNFLLRNNLHGIQRFVEKMQPDAIKTFSFGLWTTDDLVLWNCANRDIASEFGWDIETQADLFHQIKRGFLRDVIGNVTEEEVKTDFTRLNCKERVFEWWVTKNFTAGTYILIDDQVPNKTVVLHDRDMTIQFIEVTSLRSKE